MFCPSDEEKSLKRSDRRRCGGEGRVLHPSCAMENRLRAWNASLREAERPWAGTVTFVRVSLPVPCTPSLWALCGTLSAPWWGWAGLGWAGAGPFYHSTAGCVQASGPCGPPEGTAGPGIAPLPDTAGALSSLCA